MGLEQRPFENTAGGKESYDIHQIQNIIKTFSCYEYDYGSKSNHLALTIHYKLFSKVLSWSKRSRNPYAMVSWL